MIEIHLSSDEKRVLVSWGRGPYKVLHEDGTVTEQFRPEGHLIGEPSDSYEEGYDDGFREGFVEARELGEAEEKAKKAKAS